MARYRTKPCEIKAVVWNGENIDEISDFCGDSALISSLDVYPPFYSLSVSTLEGHMHASVGDYIIRGLQNEYYPCKPSVFEKKYELVE